MPQLEAENLYCVEYYNYSKNLTTDWGMCSPFGINNISHSVEDQLYLQACLELLCQIGSIRNVPGV